MSTRFAPVSIWMKARELQTRKPSCPQVTTFIVSVGWSPIVLPLWLFSKILVMELLTCIASSAGDLRLVLLGLPCLPSTSPFSTHPNNSLVVILLLWHAYPYTPRRPKLCSGYALVISNFTTAQTCSKNRPRRHPHRILSFVLS